MGNRKTMKRMNRAWISTLLAVALILQACAKEQAPPEPAVIKVWALEGNFMQFATQVKEKFPHIDLLRAQPYEELMGFGSEITDLEAYYDNVIREIEKQQPDILLYFNHDEAIAGAGLLLDLEPYVQRKSFDVDSYSVGLLDHLRTDGQLYAIADSFAIDALFYNQTLLDAYSLPHPHDEMTSNCSSSPQAFRKRTAKGIPSADTMSTSAKRSSLGVW